MAKKKAVWGIDIGQCALKAMCCTVGSDGASIEVDKYDYIEYPKLLSQADAEPEQLVNEALEQFLSRNDLRGDLVAISVPGQAGLSRFFKPPPVDAKTLPDIVKYEVKQQIPFPIDEVIWDWQQLGGTVVDGRTMDAEIGLFAMKREAVFRALQPFVKADIEVDYIQLSPLAIFNFVCFDVLDDPPVAESFDPEHPPESMVVMSMGTDTTDLIITNGIKLWLRNIPIGGNHFTKQLSRELKLTHAKAEHLKRNAKQAEDPQSVFRAMRPVFADLANEVQRSLTFFASIDKTAKISKLALLGNAAKLPGLRQYLNKQLEIDIAKVDAFRKIVGADTIAQKSFADNQLSFAPAYGLCLQGLKRSRVNTNLLPSEIVFERLIRAKKPWVLAAVSYIMLGLLVGFFFIEKALSEVRKEAQVSEVSWEAAEAAAAQLAQQSNAKKSTDDKLKEELGKFNRLAAELTSSIDQRSSWIEVLSAIYQALPKDPRIDGLEVVDPNEVPFTDRKEVYLESIETKFFKDISEWYTETKPIYDSQFDEKSGSEDVAADASVKEQATIAGQDSEQQVRGPGWVIQLDGYHFHNSSTQVMRGVESDGGEGAGRTYLINAFLRNFFHEVHFPGAENAKEGGGYYRFEDFGIYLPTIVSNTDFTEKELILADEEAVAGTNPREGIAEKEKVKQYDFTIQMAWLPRSPQQRFADKQARLEQQKADEMAAAAAADTQSAN